MNDAINDTDRTKRVSKVRNEWRESMNKCEKCGSVDISMQWRVVADSECLVKKCNRCEYVWTEKCLDYKEGSHER